MCFCTPTIRTPFCSNCNAHMFKRIMELTAERDALNSMVVEREKLKALCDQLGNALQLEHKRNVDNYRGASSNAKEAPPHGGPHDEQT